MNVHEERAVIQRNRRSVGCMRIEKIVGEGTFGLVYKARDKRNNDEVALKKIMTTRETQGFPVTAIREIKILNLMHHENIVNLREIVTYDESESDKTEPSVANKQFAIGDVFMVFDFADYDLSGLLKASGVLWTDRLKKSYMHQLLSGVEYLHSKKIIHRDLKSANILITKNNILKIADWGLARLLPSNREQKLTSPVVTLWYRSPELVVGSRYYSTEVDMWSVGCIFGELATRKAILTGEPEADQLRHIFQLTGFPTGSLLERYSKLPDWEKCMMYQKDIAASSSSSSSSSSAAASNTSGGTGSAGTLGRMLEDNLARGTDDAAAAAANLPKFASKFPELNEAGRALLARCLDLNPETRISASDALSHVFFSGIADGEGEAVLHHSELPILRVDPVTEYLDRERRKQALEAQRATAERKAAELRAAEQAMQAEATRQRIAENAARLRNTGKRSGIVGKYQVVAKVDTSKLPPAGGGPVAGVLQQAIKLGGVGGGGGSGAVPPSAMSRAPLSISGGGAGGTGAGGAGRYYSAVTSQRAPNDPTRDLSGLPMPDAKKPRTGEQGSGGNGNNSNITMTTNSNTNNGLYSTGSSGGAAQK